MKPGNKILIIAECGSLPSYLENSSYYKNNVEVVLSTGSSGSTAHVIVRKDSLICIEDSSHLPEEEVVGLLRKIFSKVEF